MKHSKKVDTTYTIYKRTQGIPWPGEFWDGGNEADGYTLKEARKVFKASYFAEGISLKKQVFHIVRCRLDVVR